MTTGSVAAEVIYLTLPADGIRSSIASQAMEAKSEDRTRASLLALPLELQWKIFELLDYPSALFLTATCHSIQSSPKNPLSFQSSNDKRTFLGDAEKFPHNGERYACFRCNSIKEHDQFSVKQVTKKRDKGNDQSVSRFCIDCGLSKGIYSGGKQVVRADGLGLVYVKCSCCLTLKRMWFCFGCTKCRDCLGLTADPVGEECPSCGRSIYPR